MVYITKLHHQYLQDICIVTPNFRPGSCGIEGKTDTKPGIVSSDYSEGTPVTPQENCEVFNTFILLISKTEVDRADLEAVSRSYIYSLHCKRTSSSICKSLLLTTVDRRTVVSLFAATTSAAPSPRACIYHSAAH